MTGVKGVELLSQPLQFVRPKMVAVVSAIASQKQIELLPPVLQIG